MHDSRSAPPASSLKSPREKPDTLVCIPAFNEESRLPATLRELKPLLPAGCDLIVIDDGSRDKTIEMARREGIDCLALPIHLGYGGALQTAYKLALDRGYTYLIQMDADGQHDPTSLKCILEPLRAGKADFIIGNRFHSGCAYRSPYLREIGRRFFSAICRILSGIALKDPTSGFKGLNRSALALLARDGFPMDYPDADVFMMIHYAGIRIQEVDILMRPPREEGSMHAGFFHPAKYFAKMLLSIFMTILRHIGGSHG